MPFVAAPTLLIVGEYDEDVLRLNERAAAMRASVSIKVVPGATHLFEEGDTLGIAAALAREWFVGHLARGSQLSPGKGPDPH